MSSPSMAGPPFPDAVGRAGVIGVGVDVVGCDAPPDDTGVQMTGFPFDDGIESGTQIFSFGNRAFRSSNNCGQKLRALTALNSGKATLSRVVASLRIPSSFPWKPRSVATFASTCCLVARKTPPACK